MKKEMMEKRAALVAQMEEMTKKADAENRAMNEEEVKQFDACEAEIRAIDATNEREERARNLNVKKEERAEDAEERAFVNYVRSRAGLEVRDGEQNFSMGNNGAIIPTSIAQRIINKIKEICPIFERCTMFSVKGTLKVPVYTNANSTHNITVGYQSEFTDITADAGAFTSVDLTGYLAGALTLLGKSVINNSDIDILSFVVDEMARRIAAFIEGEMLVGTGTTYSHATGALNTSNTIAAGSVSAISADNLIDLQARVPSAYQADACWIMNPATFTAIRKLKDGNGVYLLQSDFSSAFPYRILGRPVFLSENMPTIASAAKAVLYGDLSGYGCNMRENIEIQVLNEKYATQHAVGVVGWFEFDGKVLDSQKLATLTMSTSLS